jgi:hypothetical protein
VVSDEEPVGARLPVAASDRDVAAKKRRFHPAVEATDYRAAEKDRVLDLGVGDLAPVANSGVRPHEAVLQSRT